MFNSLNGIVTENKNTHTHIFRERMEGQSFNLLFRLMIKSQMEQIGMTFATDEMPPIFCCCPVCEKKRNFVQSLGTNCLYLPESNNESNSLSP